MEVALIKWDTSLKDDLIRICNSVDRSFLSERMPYPYTTEDADWWLGMVETHDGEDGLFRFKRSFYRGELNRFHIGRKIFDQAAYDRLVALREESGEPPADGWFPRYRG